MNFNRMMKILLVDMTILNYNKKTDDDYKDLIGPSIQYQHSKDMVDMLRDMFLTSI